MEWNIDSILGVIAFIVPIVVSFLKVFADQIKMKQSVRDNKQKHDSTSEKVDEIQDRQHEIVRRQDVTESKLIDHKELLNKIDLKLDQLLNRKI